MSGVPFRILVVCTGNICRSPMAQCLLTHRLRERLGHAAATVSFAVSSAGTGALVGQPVEPDALAVLASYGVVPEPLAARDLAAQQVEEADLVLAATRGHRAATVSLVPRASARTFTIREFARLATAAVESHPPSESSDDQIADRARQVATAAGELRGYVRADDPDDDDIPDPYQRDAAAFEAAGRQISEAVDAIVGALLAVRARP